MCNGCELLPSGLLVCEDSGFAFSIVTIVGVNINEMLPIY